MEPSRPWIVDLMTEPVTLPLDTTVGQARAALIDGDVPAVTIVNRNGRPMGVLSKTDLVYRADNDAPAAVLMSRNVITIDATAGIGDAARLLRSRDVHQVVVTDGEKMVGLLSSFDLLLALENILASLDPPATG